MQPKAHGLSRLSWLRLWSGLDASRQKCRWCDEVECQLEIGRPSLRSRVSRGRTGVPSWGSGLKACGGGASSPWQKDPRPQLPSQSLDRGGGVQVIVKHFSTITSIFCFSTRNVFFPPRAPMLVDGGVEEPIRRPRFINPRVLSFNSHLASARQADDRDHHQHTINTLQALRHRVGQLAIARLCCQVTIAASTTQRPGRPRERGLMDGVVVVALDRPRPPSRPDPSWSHS